MSIYWEYPVIGGEAPSPRSGHTFTVVGERFIVFGGCGRVNGKAQAFNDLHELDTSDPEDYKWKEISASNPPPTRARHAAIALDSNRMLVFGGLDKRTRFNDVWVLDVDEKAWKQVEVAADEEKGSPEARAHFTATRCGKKIFIFGGYGGNGQVYSDLWCLNIGDEGQFSWQDLTATIEGTGPTPRFDHSAFIYPLTPNSDTYDKLLIMGGRDLSQMLHDSHMLDLSKMAWENESQPPCLPYEICNNICDGIESVPYHKVFSFGGKKGMMQYMNQVEVMDCGSQIWSTPPVDGGVAPEGREDCAWVFDVKSCSLLIFGGWANRWLGDTIKLNVSPIIGPPYACVGIEPESGPVFGSTELIVKGLRFRDGKIQVKFGTNEKNEVIVDAEWVDNETIKVRTPNYEMYGALGVDVKVSINGEGWTVNKVKFAYFANTAARNCIAYGPGLLEKGFFGVEMPFLIQAVDTQNEKRTSGGDNFMIRVVSVEGKVEGIARVVDLNNGLFEVFYSTPMPGKYHVHAALVELATGENVPIRGSPFTVEAEDPWTKHRVVGAAPARRKGLTMVPMGDELVVYGGDKSGVSVCSTEGSDWRWSTVAPAGDAPADRRDHSCTVLGHEELVIFGGVNLADQNELSDMYYLKKVGDSWSWSHPAESRPYIRHPAVKAVEETVSIHI